MKRKKQLNQIDQTERLEINQQNNQKSKFSNQLSQLIQKRFQKQDMKVLLWGALFCIFWDVTDWDLQTMRWVADSEGFYWRTSWLTQNLIHAGGRKLGWFLFCVMLLDAFRPILGSNLLRQPSQGERFWWCLGALFSILLVQVLKYHSSTSCPWDLMEFNSIAFYISHWDWVTNDGGPGHCFPSGHASAGFVFLTWYFLWRTYQPRLAKQLLIAALLLGLIFGFGQWFRGAHYPSHIFWSAWFCWMSCMFWRAVNVRINMR